MDQNLSLYRIFHTVAKTGNISKASKELFISQPAISKSISKLESSLEVTLFHRNSRGVSLTEEGKILYDSTCSAFETLELAGQRIEKIKTLGIGQIRIGVSTTLCKYILLPYLQRFIEQYPHIKITIDCSSTFETIKMLEENKLDIGLIAKPTTLDHLTFYPITEIKDCFVATKSYIDNLLLREEDFTFENIFQKANILLLDEKNITRLFIEEYFTKHNITTNQVLEISNMDLLIDFAKISLGVACVIKNFVQDDLASGSLIEIPLTNPLDARQVGFTYSTKFPLTDSMKHFIEFYQHSENNELQTSEVDK